MEHTPMAVQVLNGGGSGEVVALSVDGVHFASMPASYRERAAFIVQAVNAHQALVEALERALAVMGSIPEHAADYSGDRAAIRAALKLAKGEE